MDTPASDAPKLPAMVMCGDHPSITKTELNAKEAIKLEEKEKSKDKPTMSYARISVPSGRMARALSEHGLRVRPAPAHSAQHNHALVQAALGSFRWPPYLLCVWVVVLVVTHLLHCLVSLLERALPNFKNACEYLRSWTIEAWNAEGGVNQRVFPCALACATCASYALYAALCALRAAALWAVEPLCPDDAPAPAPAGDLGVHVTDYVTDVASKTSSSIKH